MHNGTSRSIGRIGEICGRNERVLGEGPAALLYRIVDTMVDNYRPEVDKLGDRLDSLEKEVFARPKSTLVKRILDFKRDVSSLRRVIMPERDAVARLGRREFSQIPEQLSYRFRDVYDHLVRLSDEAVYFQDRISSLLDAHLSNVSNQLNSVMKVLTIISTIFMPMTVLTGMYGMNVPLPHLPGGDARAVLVDSGDYGLGDFGHARVFSGDEGGCDSRQSTVGSRQSQSTVSVGSPGRQSKSFSHSRQSQTGYDHRSDAGTVDVDCRLRLPTGTADWD